MKRKKIAILGGGIASLTTAFELTSQSGWDSLYEITIYQKGWRLGGKCATGRNIEVRENIEPDYRIQEHGLHIFFGFYENAFRIMKECYDELGSQGPFQTVEDAFKPHNYIVLEEKINGNWKNIDLNFAPNDLLPWEGHKNVNTIWQHIRTTIKFTFDIFEQATSIAKSSSSQNWLEKIARQTEIAGDIFEAFSAEVLIAIPEEIIESFLRQPERLSESNLEDLEVFSNSTFLKLVYDLVDTTIERNIQPKQEEKKLIFKLIDKFTERFNRLIEREIASNDELVWRFNLIDLALTNLRGIFRDGVLESRCLDDLEDIDYREWLRRNGAREATLNCAFVRVLYELVYGFSKGNIADPQLATGTALRILTTVIFQYNGAIMWKMQSGMAETVITPMYKVLQRRGVKFEFFESVKQLHLDRDKKSIAQISIDKQVNLKKEIYNPLIEVKGLSCWPDRPLYEQIVDSEAQKLKDEKIDLESFWTSWQNVEQIRLEAGKDFDIVVLGISLASLPCICGELIEAQKKWHDMVNKIETVNTIGGQIWLKPTLKQSGWQSSSPVLGSYYEPLSVYADMSETIPTENWSSDYYPYNAAYFTGVFSDPGIPTRDDYNFPQRVQQKADAQAIKFLENQIGHLWPDATTRENPSGLNWDLVIDYDNNVQGAKRFKSQYWRVNINPSERYVLSIPGSSKYRLKTDESGFDNLYLVGDWIDNGYNSGCVEATVMSSLQCTRSILKQCFNLKYSQEIYNEGDCWL